MCLIVLFLYLYICNHMMVKGLGLNFSLCFELWSHVTNDGEGSRVKFSFFFNYGPVSGYVTVVWVTNVRCIIARGM